MRQRISTGTEIVTQIGLFEFISNAELKHEQKRTFKRNRQQAAMNTADHMQGARIDIKDERKAERQREREQKRKQYKY